MPRLHLLRHARRRLPGHRRRGVSPLPARRRAPGVPVTDWNARAKQAIADTAQQLPWEQTRSFAMVSGAVYDAVNAIDGAPYRPYLVAPPAHRSYSKDAAVATAAHDVLVGLFPRSSRRWTSSTPRRSPRSRTGPARPAESPWAAKPPTRCSPRREHDGVDAVLEWPVGTQPGEWRPVPPFNIGISAQIGFMRTFAIPDADLFRSPSPNALTSARYATDFNEVKSVGSAASTTQDRRPDGCRALLGRPGTTRGGRSSTRSRSAVT